MTEPFCEKSVHGKNKFKDISIQQFVKDYAVKSIASCFSGGKDSLVATHLIMNELENRSDIDKWVVFADTGIMLPTTEPFIKDVCKKYGWKLTAEYEMKKRRYR